MKDIVKNLFFGVLCVILFPLAVVFLSLRAVHDIGQEFIYNWKRY